MYQPADQGFATYFLAMLADEDRNVKYAEAIKQCIAQFRKQQGRAPLVLDLGCGTGLLTRLALMHGAAKGRRSGHEPHDVFASDLPPKPQTSIRQKNMTSTTARSTTMRRIKILDLTSWFRKFWAPYTRVKTYPNTPRQASKYLNTFDTCTYVVPSVCSTYLRTVVVRDDATLPPVCQAYGRDLLKQCTRAWTPRELGAYFLERCDVEGRVEVRTDFFGKVPFQKKRLYATADQLEWPESDGVDLQCWNLNVFCGARYDCTTRLSK